jgi:hypothetical protein
MENVLEVNTEKTKCRFGSRQQNAAEYHNLKGGKKPFKIPGPIAVLGTTINI